MIVDVVNGGWWGFAFSLFFAVSSLINPDIKKIKKDSVCVFVCVFWG